MSFITEQPTILAPPTMSLAPCDRKDGETNHRQCSSSGRCRHSGGLGMLQRFRTRRLIIPAIVLLLVIGFLFWLEYSGIDGGEIGAKTNFLRRALQARDDSNFIRHKLYLIIVFVGAFILLWLFVALSYWFCRGVFENPICCPCYLCAYCGGLACLECITCC